MKVLLSYFQIESNENVTGFTELDSFNIKFEEDLISSMYVKDIFEENNVEIIPGIYANGHAAKVMSKEGYNYVNSKLIRIIKENLHQLDGIFLFLHGASKIEDLAEGSGDRQLLKDIRKITGPYLPIAVVMDPHGNLTEEYVSQMNYGRSYRHSPHTDIKETFERSARDFIDILKEKETVNPIYRKLPFVLGGEKSVSTDEPMVSINKKLDEIESDDRLRSVSFHVGYLRHDNYATGSGLIIVPKKRKYQKFAEEKIDELYEYCVSKYDEFHYHGNALEVEEAIEEAISTVSPHTVVTDSGDNVTSGAPGYNTTLLDKFLNQDLKGKRVLFSAITDAKLFHKLKNLNWDEYHTLYIGNGETELDQPIQVEAKIVNKGNLQQIFGVTDNYGDTYTIQLKDKNIDIVIIDQSISFAEMHQFQAANINLKEYDIVVVKQGYIFPELAEYSSHSIMALTNGPTNQRTEKLIFRQIQRPMLPFDKL